jgi:hypothetical protein
MAAYAAGEKIPAFIKNSDRFYDGANAASSLAGTY